MSEEKSLDFFAQSCRQPRSFYLKLRKLAGPYVISGFQFAHKGSRSPVINWNHLDHPSLVYIFCFRYDRNVLSQILLGDSPQSYLEIEIKDCSLRVSLPGKKALQNLWGDRCFNSQHLLSGPGIKQAKDPTVVTFSRVIQNLLLKVLAFGHDLNDHLWTPNPIIVILTLESYLAHYLNFLAIDELRTSDRTIVATSVVDLSRTAMLEEASVSCGTILISAVVAAWWPLYLSTPETVPKYLARVPPDKWLVAQLIVAYEPGVHSGSIMGSQSPVEVSLQPGGAPMAGPHTLPWPSPPCQQQRQSPCSTPMAAIPQEPRVAPNTRSDAPVWRGLLPLTQSSTLRICCKIRCRRGVTLWATRGSSSFPCSPH